MAAKELDSGRPAGRRRFVLRFVLGTVVLVVGGLAVCFYFLVRDARDAALRCRSMCPLNQLQLALQNYHHVHGCFPPAYIADENGRPMHSWRVLILPFIEDGGLYAAYRFDEPWDGPNNRQLADRMPAIFHIDSEPPSTRMTNVVAIVGPGTAFPGPTSTRLEDFADGPGQTILLTEIANSDIAWLEPRDLHVDTMSFRINDSSKPSISCSRHQGPHVVFADRIHAYQLGPALRPETLRALTTVAGGEQMFIGEVLDVGFAASLNGAAALASLDDGPATDERIEKLNLDNLRSLWLSRSDVTDTALERLATARLLSRLCLRGTPVTDEGVRRLQHALPDCRIER
ncbi:MAG TPA: hypothetical protein DD670_12745 [Planctomycetaceae bacterium]|nr:hypothetical protein [Planctomycetaceae bacterium]